jgi:hypothetical protein
MLYSGESSPHLLELVALLWVQLVLIGGGIASIACYAIRKHRILRAVHSNAPNRNLAA